MRIECDYCLAVYESEGSENEETAVCPFCASRPNRTTARQFLAAPARPRVRTAPFGIEVEPAREGRTSIVCPPASRRLQDSVRPNAETLSYVRAADPVVPDVTSQDPVVPREDLPGIDPPPAFVSERRRPAYDWALPPIRETGSDSAHESARSVVSGLDSDRPTHESMADAPRLVDIPRTSPLPRISESPPPEGNTDRPFVRSDRSPSRPPRRRRTAAAWAPFVLLGAMGAALVVRGSLTKPVEEVGKIEKKEAPLPVSVAAEIAAVEEGMSVGDFERALGALDRATRVAPRDPLVLVERAKVAVERADVAWLVRKTTPAAPSDGPSFEDFVNAASEARAAAAEALRASPENDEARRAAVNAFRIFGEIDRARELAADMRDRQSPDATYTLAALELASLNVPPANPVALLRQNGWAAGFPGKGLATLVYALVRAGDVQGARVELDKLDLLARPHPATAALRALVEASRANAKSPAAAPVPRRDKATTTRLCPEDGKAGQRDARSLLREAANARCHGDLTAARNLYQSLLDHEPSDSDALTGMGDLSRQEDNWDAARNFYAEALRSNPTFLPAALGAADVEWDVGNLAVAQRKYRDILDAFPRSACPPRAVERARTSAKGSGGSG